MTIRQICYGLFSLFGRYLPGLLLCSCVTASGDETGYFLLTYTPGASWNHEISYEKQPGLNEHHDYLKDLHLDDILVMGGEVDGDEALGVMLIRTGSLKEAEKLASADPGVRLNLVKVAVLPWRVNMSSMRQVQQKAPAQFDNPEQSFSIKRVDPESRINIED